VAPAELTALDYTRPAGVPDQTRATSRRHRWIEARLMEVFERYGFEPTGVPTIEYRELYHPDRIGESLYHQLVMARVSDAAEFPGGVPGAGPVEPTHDVALRPDFTAPLARAFVTRLLDHGRPPDLPHRLAYAGQVFRDVHPSPLRFREFRQIGIELVGSSSAYADLEVLCVARDCMTAVGVPDWRLHLGHNALFREILSDLGLTGKTRDAVANGLVISSRVRMRVRGSDAQLANYMRGLIPELLRRLTHLTGASREEAERRWPELFSPTEVPLSRWRARLPELYDEALWMLWNQTHRPGWPQGGSWEDVSRTVLTLAALDPEPDRFFAQIDPLITGDAARAHRDRLRWLCDELGGLPDAAPVPLLLTASASRGIRYYTGLTFEIHTPNTAATHTDICGGGRYEDLHRWLYERARETRALRTGRAPPPLEHIGDLLTGVGMSFGVERLAAALPPPRPAARRGVYVAVQHPDLQHAAFTFVAQLRTRGVQASCTLPQLHSGDALSLRHQVGRANHAGARFAVIFGAEEWQTGQVALRDLETGTQQPSPLADAIDRLSREAR